MPNYEYKVVPAPKKPGKIKGVKGTDNRFAAELAGLMNRFGAEGWEYQRTDTLPCEERKGLTGRVTTFQNMLVFRRTLEEAVLEAPAQPSLVQEAAAEQQVAEPSAPAPQPAAPAPIAAEQAPEQPPQNAPVFSFRSAAAPAPEAPRVTATKEAPEGNPPEIRFRPSSGNIAAQ